MGMAAMKLIPGASTIPKRGDRRDCQGEIRCIGVVDGYVVARRKGRTPFLLSLSEWRGLGTWPPGVTQTKP